MQWLKSLVTEPGRDARDENNNSESTSPENNNSDPPPPTSSPENNNSEPQAPSPAAPPHTSPEKTDTHPEQVQAEQSAPMLSTKGVGLACCFAAAAAAAGAGYYYYRRQSSNTNPAPCTIVENSLMGFTLSYNKHDYEGYIGLIENTSEIKDGRDLINNSDQFFIKPIQPCEKIGPNSPVIRYKAVKHLGLAGIVDPTQSQHSFTWAFIQTAAHVNTLHDLLFKPSSANLTFLQMVTRSLRNKHTDFIAEHSVQRASFTLEQFYVCTNALNSSVSLMNITPTWFHQEHLHDNISLMTFSISQVH